jgi:SAM-dependent methyltransferase
VSSGESDRARWNARYDGFPATFAAHPLAVAALARPLPAGPVLDLACGASGSALALAAAGRQVTAVDISDVALDLLAAEAWRRGLAGLIDLVHADLGRWRPEPARYALVLCTGYWDREVFAAASAAVATGPGPGAGGNAAAGAGAASPGAATPVCPPVPASPVPAGPGGLLAWQALTQAARRDRPGLPAAWCLEPGQPSALLPPGFTVLEQADEGRWRRLLARRG